MLLLVSHQSHSYVICMEADPCYHGQLVSPSLLIRATGHHVTPKCTCTPEVRFATMSLLSSPPLLEWQQGNPSGTQHTQMGNICLVSFGSSPSNLKERWKWSCAVTWLQSKTTKIRYLGFFNVKPENCFPPLYDNERYFFIVWPPQSIERPAAQM